jgi:tetratricopeptide (TPR) repeat protein
MGRTVLCVASLAVFCLALNAQSYEDLFREAGESSARRDYDGAIVKFKAALKLRPGAPEAMSNLGVMYHLAGRYRDAVETMERVVESSPDLFPARLVLGLDLVRLDRTGEAVPHLEAARKLAPGSHEAALGLAAAYVGENRLQQAADIYETESRSASSDAESWYGLGLCYERMAEAASRRLSRATGGAVLDKRFLSEFLLDRGEVRLAEETMREAAALEVQQPSVEAKQAYEDARRLAVRSRDAFSRLVEAAPDAWQSKLFLADLSRQQRSFPAAIANYKAAERALPTSPGPKLGLATVYWELGQFEESEKYLRAVLELNPKSPQALFQLGNIRVRQHREEEAIPLLTAFLAMEPDSLSACADLGRAYFHVRRDQEAVMYLEKARPIDQQGDIHYQLATVLKRLGRTSEAVESLRISKLLRQREMDRQQRLRGVVGPDSPSFQK